MCAALSSGLPVAQAAKATKPTIEEPAKQSAAKAAADFVIVGPGAHYSVMTRAEADALELQNKEQLQKVKVEWETSKKAAEAAHQKFETPMPHAQTVRVVHGSYTSQQTAETAMQTPIAKTPTRHSPKPSVSTASPKHKTSKPAHHTK